MEAIRSLFSGSAGAAQTVFPPFGLTRVAKMVFEAKVPTSFKVTHTIEPILSAGPVLLAEFEGNEVLVTRFGGKVSLLNPQNGVALKNFAVIEDEDKSISSLAVSSSHIFTALSNNLIESREISTGTLSRSWKAHSSPVLCMVHHPCGEFLATGSADHTVRVWNSSQGFCTHNLKGVHGGVVTALKFHPDSNVAELFSSADDGTIAQWNLLEGKKKTSFKSHVSSVRALDVSQDGLFLVSGGRDQVINIWNLKTGALLHTIPTMESIETISFIGLNIFASGGEKGILRYWDVKTGTCIKESKKLTSGEHGLSQIVKCKNNLNVTTSDLQILSLTLDSFEVLSSIPGNLDEVTDVAFLEDGALAVATNDSVLRIFSSLDSRACESLFGHSASILSLATCGPWIVSGSRDNMVCLWKKTAATGYACVAILPGHTDAVGAVCIGTTKDNGENPIFASASADMTIKMWEVQGKESSGFTVVSRWTIKGHEKDINSISFTPNMKCLISGSQDKTAKVWKIDDGSLAGTLKGHKRGVWSVKCSPLEQVIATASGDQTIKLWSATTFECLKTFEGHSNSVLRVAFLRKGTELISTGSDGLVKIWDIRSNECSRTFDEHLDRIWTLTLHEKSGKFASGDASGIIKIWQDCTEEEIAQTQQTQENQLLMEQDLSNMLVRKDFKNAIIMSMQLEQPFRLFGLLNEFTKGNTTEESTLKLRDLFASLPGEKLNGILLYIRDWNTSFKRSALAQVILHVLLRMRLDGEKGADDTTAVELPGLKECCKALLPYTERHFEHIQELQSDAFLVDFVLSHMENYMVE